MLTMAALVLAPMILISGFATDLGAWYAEGIRIQRAADSAALAGVVWLPDFARARTVALAAAANNGFDDAASDIAITVTQVGANRLTVNIFDNDVPRYLSQLAVRHKTLERSSTAEFTTPVPLGSPRNFFGTGNLLPAQDAEGFTAAINGYCSAKEQGDPFSPGFMGNAFTDGVECPADTANDEYKPSSQYGYVIDVVAGRTGPIEVSILSPRTNPGEFGDSATSKVTTTFRLRSPDGTPFNDNDNPTAACAGGGEANPKVFRPGGPVPGEPAPRTLLGAGGWVRLCTIPSSAPAGRYLLDVSSEAEEYDSVDFNSYAVIASYGGAGGTCDRRVQADCPRVSAREWMSIRAQSNSPIASFFLAEIPDEHAGHTMNVTLFDPGEGGDFIELIDPSGTPFPFTWSTSDGTMAGGTTQQLQVGGTGGQVGPNRLNQGLFNERYVSLVVQLPGDYATRYPFSKWWRVRYHFAGNVDDRTTWSVRIDGDPVHLVK